MSKTISAYRSDVSDVLSGTLPCMQISRPDSEFTVDEFTNGTTGIVMRVTHEESGLSINGETTEFRIALRNRLIGILEGALFTRDLYSCKVT